MEAVCQEHQEAVSNFQNEIRKLKEEKQELGQTLMDQKENLQRQLYDSTFQLRDLN